MKYYLKIALQHFSMGLIIPVSVIWKLHNGLSLPEAVLTESLVLVVTALADLPAGFIANRINNYRSLLLGGLLHFVGMTLLAVGSSLLIFVMAAVVTGLAWAFISGADEAYIHDDFIEDKKEYKKVFAAATIVDEAATIVGMLGSSLLLYLHVNMRVLFVVASIVLLLHVAYTFIFLPRSQQLAVTHPANLAKTLLSGAFKSGQLAKVALLMIAFAVIYEAVRPLWQPHLQDIDINIANFGIIFALLKLASIGGSALAAYRELHLRDVVGIFFLMLAAFLAFGTAWQVVSIIALCLYLFTENYFRVYMSAVMNKLITTNRAAILSVGSVIRNAAGALIIAGAGIFSQHSIFIALVVVAALKIPAMVYVVVAHRASAT